MEEYGWNWDFIADVLNGSSSSLHSHRPLLSRHRTGERSQTYLLHSLRFEQDYRCVSGISMQWRHSTSSLSNKMNLYVHIISPYGVKLKRSLGRCCSGRTNASSAGSPAQWLRPCESTLPGNAFGHHRMCPRGER